MENALRLAVVANRHVTELANMDRGVIQGVQRLSNETALHATNSHARLSQVFLSII